jgi:hypothetical protein
VDPREEQHRHVIVSYAADLDKGEGRFIVSTFRRIGYRVTAVNRAAAPILNGRPGAVVDGYPAEISIQAIIERYGPADIFLYVEPSGLLPKGLEASPIATVAIIGDTHRDLRIRQTFARFFDLVFLYHRNYLRCFDEHIPGSVQWLPYACDTEVFRDLGLDRDLDVAFVGHLFGVNSERSRILCELQSRGLKINEQRYVSQNEIPQIYSRAKIVLNVPLADDLNYRFFEALSCGALLLTRRVNNGQEELFRENEHYVAYDTKEELLDKVSYYLAHPAERQRIALSGYNEVQAKHTLEIRLKTIVAESRLLAELPAPIRKMKRSDVNRHYARFYDYYGEVESCLRLVAEQDVFKLQYFQLLGIAARSATRRLIRRW